MSTVIRNVLGAPVTLPAPYQQILVPGDGIVVADDVATVVMALGGTNSVVGVFDITPTKSHPEVTALAGATRICHLDPAGSDNASGGGDDPVATVEEAVKRIGTDWTGNARIISGYRAGAAPRPAGLGQYQRP